MYLLILLSEYFEPLSLAAPTTAAPTTAAPTWFALAQNNEKRHHAVFDPTWTVSFRKG